MVPHEAHVDGQHREQRSRASYERHQRGSSYGSAADILPPSGWVCVTCEEEEVTFRPEAGAFVLFAERTLDGPWELRCVERAREAACNTLLGVAPTRTVAVDRLFECMDVVNERQGLVEPISVPMIRKECDWARGLDGTGPYVPRIQ